jgi:site-specific DNA-methyltransferase (adenine-specific)
LARTGLFRRKVKFPLIQESGRGFLASADALDFARTLRDNIADIVFLDSPFNLGKDYGIAADVDDDESDVYEWYLRVLIAQLIRVLKPGGALFLYHLPYWASRLTPYLQAELEFRHWIAIAMKNGFARGSRLYPAHYALLYYTKGPPASFTRPRISPQICRHCSGIVKDYGGYKGIIDEKGVNLSDFWDDISPVRHESRKLRTANQLPELITNRVVSIAGGDGGLLVDPFMGTGTALVSAKRAGMSYVGNDIAEPCVEIARERLAACESTVGANGRQAK